MEALERAAALLDAGYDNGYGVTSLDTLLCEDMSRAERLDFAAFLASAVRAETIEECALRALHQTYLTSVDAKSADIIANAIRVMASPHFPEQCRPVTGRAAVTAFLEDEAHVERVAEGVAMPVWEVAPETFRTLSAHQREFCHEIARAAIAALRDALLIQTNASEESK